MQYTPKEIAKKLQDFIKTTPFLDFMGLTITESITNTFCRKYFGVKNFGLSLCRTAKSGSTCPGGGIGRRAGLKIQ